MADPKKTPAEDLDNMVDDLDDMDDQTPTAISNQAINDRSQHKVTKENVHDTGRDDLTEETAMD